MRVKDIKEMMITKVRIEKIFIKAGEFIVRKDMEYKDCLEDKVVALELDMEADEVVVVI